MVVSRKHFVSLASMPLEAVQEYEKMVQMFFKLPEVGRNLLEAEHGSTDKCDAGACVAHTHIHLLPGLAEQSDFFDGALHVAGTFNGFSQLRGYGKPYILLRANLGTTKIFHAEDVPTQAIRRMLCDRLGQPNWDWRTDPRDAIIGQTVNFWKRALENAKVA